MPYINLVGNGSAMMVERATFKDAGGYDPRLRAACVEGCEDFLLQLKLACLGPVACTPKYLVGYRRDGTGMSACKSTMRQSSILARQLFDDWLSEQGRQLTAHSQSSHWIKSAEYVRAGRVDFSEGRIWRGVKALGHAVRLDPVGMIGSIAYKPVSAGKRIMRIVTPNPSFFSVTDQSAKGLRGSPVVSRRIRRLQSLNPPVTNYGRTAKSMNASNLATAPGDEPSHSFT